MAKRAKSNKIEVEFSPESELQALLGHLVALHWIDTQSQSAWVTHDELMEFNPSHAVTIGVLLDVSEDRVLLAADWLVGRGGTLDIGPGYVLDSSVPSAFGGATAIPRAWLNSFADFGVVFGRSVIESVRKGGG